MNWQKKSLRKRSHSETKQSLPSKPSWVIRVRDGFSALTAILAFVSAILGILVVYAGNKGLFHDLTNDFYSWLYEEKAWTGLFNNFPEGYIDMASMELSDTTSQLVLIGERGELGGVMADKKLCKVGFPHGYKLVKGDIAIFGNRATITIWDLEFGYPKDYAEFDLKRNGVVLEVTPKRNSSWFGKETVRVAQHPDMDTDKAIKDLLDFCAEEKEELFKGLKLRPPASGKREPLSQVPYPRDLRG